MNNKKTVIRFFTIADYEDEEIWLHNQHMSGWKLVKMIHYYRQEHKKDRYGGD